MQISEIMTRQVEVIPPGASIEQAARTMKELDVGMLPVCDGDRLLGTLTDRDITIRAIAEGRDPSDTIVEDVMTHDLVYCFEDQEVKDAAQVMYDHQIRRL